MAFEVADFETFFAILGQHPEWQVRLRRMLLDEATADSRRAMEEGFARLTATLESFASETRPQLGKLESDVAGLTATLESFASETQPRLDTLESDVGTLKEDVGTLKDDVATLKTDVGTLKGDSKENWYRNRASNIFGKHLDRVRVIGMGDLAGLRQAVRSGRISDDEWDDAQRLDLMVSGRDDDGRAIVVAVEVSFKLDADDVLRAARRAGVLRKAGLLALAAVAGPEVGPHVEALAAENGVAVLRDGVTLTWPNPS